MGEVVDSKRWKYLLPELVGRPVEMIDFILPGSNRKVGARKTSFWAIILLLDATLFKIKMMSSE